MLNIYTLQDTFSLVQKYHPIYHRHQNSLCENDRTSRHHSGWHVQNTTTS